MKVSSIARCCRSERKGALWKTLSFSILHFTIALTVAYLLTGSALTGGLIAIVAPACNTVAFYFHEKVWQRYQHESQ
ncbi:DUF2061 domain-containing protein [Pseudomonas sp. TWI672]|uniref:DUF2061 domain-containing protein n=1 Tax=unclassified Pseudomonas TaxID=196821 RepID=UPI00320ACB53